MRVADKRSKASGGKSFDILLKRLSDSSPSTHSFISKYKKTPVKKKFRWKRIILFVMVTFVLAMASGIYIWYGTDSTWNMSNVNTNGSKAAIVDELSASYQDTRFLNNVTNTLKTSGYSVDYYAPSQVTVSFYRNLPLQGYGLIVFRGHSGNGLIYTSEEYSQSKYVTEQLTGQLERVLLDGKYYFAITPSFVQHSMDGRMDGSLVIAMGCSGLGSPNMAQAFVARGARAFVGWDISVSAIRTDDVTMSLLHSLTLGDTVKQAIVQAQFTSTTLDGRRLEPPYGGRLAYYDTSMVPKEQFAARLFSIFVWLPLIMIPAVPVASVGLFLKISNRK